MVYELFPVPLVADQALSWLSLRSSIPTPVERALPVQYRVIVCPQLKYTCPGDCGHMVDTTQMLQPPGLLWLIMEVTICG